jgi:hypothetical protein
MSILYVLHCDGKYKIGITTSTVTKRVRSLQTGSPYKITRYWSKRCSNYQEMERYFHRKFAKKRLCGEWFALDDKDLEFIKSCKRYSLFTSKKKKIDEASNK